jgi:hypothetical protein
VRHEVVIEPAVSAHPAGHDTRFDLGVGHHKVYDGVDVVPLQEERRLPLGAGEPVDDEAVVPVVHLEPLLHDLFDDVVADEGAGIDVTVDPGAKLGVVLQVPPEDVADFDVFQLVPGREATGLGPLPAPLDAHDDVLPHRLMMTRRENPVPERGAVGARMRT